MTKWHTPIKERILNGCIPEPNTGCWLWIKSRQSENGYGTISINKRIILTHRASWEAFNGPIPKDLCVLHKCDVMPCVNPDHLFLGTYEDNARDCVAKGRNKSWPGNLNGRAKLTENDVIAIRKSPLSGSQLAKIYGMNKSAICRARTSTSWKCVT